MRKEIRIKGVDLTTVFKLDNGHGIEASGKSCFYVMSYLKHGISVGIIHFGEGRRKKYGAIFRENIKGAGRMGDC